MQIGGFANPFRDLGKERITATEDNNSRAAFVVRKPAQYFNAVNIGHVNIDTNDIGIDVFELFEKE